MSDRIGVGLVGAGWMGSVLLRRLAERDDVRVTWLCQRSQDRALLDELALHEARVTSEFEDLVADPATDAVFLCGPNAHHGAQAIRALEADKHVFCEKPAATEEAEFRRQLELCRQKPELVTLVDYILHFDEMEERLAGLIADGAFGTVSQIQVNYRHGVNTAGGKAWKLDGSLMGDAIGMGIIHALYCMVRAMSSQARPVAVFAHSRPALVRPFENDPIWTIQVHFDSGATGVCLGNIDNGFGYDAFHGVMGTEGMFQFDSLADPPQKIRMKSPQFGDDWIYPLSPDCPEPHAWRGAALPDSGNVMDHQTDAVVGHFIDCVKNGEQSPLSMLNSALVGELGWAALRSSESGTVVAL